MIPGMNPKKMKKMMSQMGISQEDIEANRVVIEQEDKNIIIENPEITKVSMQGKETLQISGDMNEEGKENYNEEDIKQVIEKTDCSEEEAKKALDENDGDLAETIMSLS